MKFNYQNTGDIIYKVEEFRFRYNNRHAVVIELLDFLVQDEFAYQFEIDKSIEIPKPLRNSSSGNYDLLREYNLDAKGTFSTKEEALQHAIDLVSAILEKHSSISLNKDKQNI